MTKLVNCNFTGVKFDEAATDAVHTIAEALLENAKALGALAFVLKASNVTIETLLKLEPTPVQLNKGGPDEPCG